MYCSSCGEKLGTSARFCSACGAKVEISPGDAAEPECNDEPVATLPPKPAPVVLSDEERERLKEKHRKQAVFIALGMGLLAVLVLMNGLLTNYQEDQERKAQAAEMEKLQQEQREREQARTAELVENLPAATAALQANFAAFDTAAARGDFVAAKSALSEAKAVLRPYRELKEPVQEAQNLIEGLETRKALAGIDAAIQKADEAASAKRWIAADDEYSRASGSLSALDQGAMHEKVVAALAGRIERGQKRIASKVKTAREERAQLEALKATCGKKPERSAWDGEIVGLESAVKRTAHDPGSIDIENCTEPVLTEACWRTTCQVRGKNAFGAQVLNSMTFLVVNRNGIAEVLAVE